MAGAGKPSSSSRAAGATPLHVHLLVPLLELLPVLGPVGGLEHLEPRPDRVGELGPIGEGAAVVREGALALGLARGQRLAHGAVGLLVADRRRMRVLHEPAVGEVRAAGLVGAGGLEGGE